MIQDKNWSPEELKAAETLRSSLIAKADADKSGAPLWHGWAIIEAFLAGIEHVRTEPRRLGNVEMHRAAEYERWKRSLAARLQNEYYQPGNKYTLDHFEIGLVLDALQREEIATEVSSHHSRSEI